MNDIEREAFQRAAPDRSALKRYGFTEDEEGSLRFSAPIVDGDFSVEVTISSDDALSSRVIDEATGEEYLPIFAEAHVGAFVGRVREEYSAFLRRIADACFVRAPFSSPQANRLAARIFTEYGEREDRPFEKSPECASFRVPETKKWYALVMPVRKKVLAGEKESPDADKTVEVVNLKADEAAIPSLTKTPGIYPAYHMNRRYWISVLLDGTVDDGLLFELVASSRAFAEGRSSLSAESYIVPSAPLIYDVDAHFEREGDIMWHQPKSAKVGDTVYIYYGAPVSAVRWKCEITKVGQIDHIWGDERPQMVLRPLVKYDGGYCTFKKLGELGIRAVRATRRATKQFVRYMDEYEGK